MLSLTRVGDGYLLEFDQDLVDAERSRALGRAARAADGAAAIPLFDAALALWNGPALADAPDTERVTAIRHGLAEERLSMLQDRLACMLACGREREAAAELPAALARHPLNERLAGMLMATWYRAGQRAEALAVFRQIRGRLVAELGVEPGAELQLLHQRILAGDVGLAPATIGGGAPVPANGHHAGTGNGQRPGPAVGQPGQAGGQEHAGTFPVLPVRPWLVPRQLPAAPAQFIDRAAELARLDELIGQTAEPSGEAQVRAVVGSPGIGKSALATVWAHRAAGHFPDGQLYVNLKGFGPAARPVLPEQAIRGFLQALGVPSAEIPESPDAQAALYRSVLAGKRVLVVLDNARDADQVRPLLPGSSRCAVLITSRARLDGLVATVGARILTLDVMSEAEARELIVRRLGTPGPRRSPRQWRTWSGCARACRSAWRSLPPAPPPVRGSGWRPCPRSCGGPGTRAWTHWRPRTPPAACVRCSPGPTASSACQRRGRSGCSACIPARTSPLPRRRAWAAPAARRRAGRWPS